MAVGAVQKDNISEFWSLKKERAAAAVALTKGASISIPNMRIRDKSMTVRTTETTITFRHPFWMSCFDRSQPAGTYRLVFDDDEILGVSFLAYQRSATMLHTPPIPVA